MKLGLHGLHRCGLEPGTLARLIGRAEDVGFESLWVGDHIALPYSDGVEQYSAVDPRLEALVALTYIAAKSSRLRIGAGVVVLPQRQPVLLTKQLSTIDYLCEGRLIIGIGLGHIEEELNALGVSLNERAARADEYLNAMRALWSDEDFAGRYVQFNNVRQRPLPRQRPHPPIVFGGHSTSALRRAIRSGNGWYGWGLTVEETEERLQALARIAAEESRPASLGTLEISITPPEIPTAEQTARYADLGVARLILTPLTASENGFEHLVDLAAEELLPLL